jgi:two-component system phosphate regulon response regulator PhoB
MKVLLVEDDASLSGVITRNLSAHGHSVKVKDTAEGAILEMLEEWPDVLILDVNLPDFSAWEVLRRLGEESRRRLRVVVMSAFPISEKRIAEFRPQSALQKPFPISALLHAVENPQTDMVMTDG